MSDSNHYSGVITITPPVTAASKIREAPETEDARLRVIRAVTPTGQGEIIVLTADAIEPACDGFSGYRLVEDIQALVDHIGPGHEYGGAIQVQWDAGYQEPVPQRYVIRGGKVETITPTLTWPGTPSRLTDEFGNDLGEITEVSGTDSADPDVKAYNVYVIPPADTGSSHPDVTSADPDAFYGDGPKP